VLDIFVELWNEGIIDDIRRRFQYRENHEVYLPRVA
jgi:hypothetical protein